MVIVRNILAVIIGWFIGSIVNMSLINYGYGVFPLVGVDTNDMEALAVVMPHLEPKFFTFPFLAHALGTLVGAFIAGLIAASHRMKFSYSIGGLFLIGGITMAYLIPAPLWFVSTDLLLAYIPMAWLGGKIVLLVTYK